MGAEVGPVVGAETGAAVCGAGRNLHTVGTQPCWYPVAPSETQPISGQCDAVLAIHFISQYWYATGVLAYPVFTVTEVEAYVPALAADTVMLSTTGDHVGSAEGGAALLP